MFRAQFLSFIFLVHDVNSVPVSFFISILFKQIYIILPAALGPGVYSAWKLEI
jgi:hypothetical protein